MSKFGNLMQTYMMGNPKRANWFLTHMPEKIWHKIGTKKALEVFHEAARRVPAYKDFLKNHKIMAEKIKNIEDFKKVPWTDKKNYLSKYELEELCLDGDLYQTHTISSSSGSAAESFYWPRLPFQDKMSENILELTYKNCYGIHRDSTLFIVCFALGAWVAGEMCLGLAQAIAKKDYPMTVVSPGMDIQESLKIIKNLGKKYDQMVIAGYPPSSRI
jgi:phenylacetate-CoA ligase